MSFSPVWQAYLLQDILHSTTRRAPLAVCHFPCGTNLKKTGALVKGLG